MRIVRSKEWWLAKARSEGDSEVSAGLHALVPHVSTTTSPSTAEETRVAFGKFINLMRRQRRLSVEKLAELADVDVADVVNIEDDVHYLPDPRTVYRLAEIFSVPQQRLMQLAGLAVASDDTFREQAIRFAARSESMQKLNSEESAALEAFVSILSKRDDEKKAP